MSRLPRTLIIPALGLGIMLALTVGLGASASRSPEARLHQAVVSYLRALQAGDARGAARLRESPDPVVEAGRAEALRGVKYFVAGQALAAGSPGEGHVRVFWLSDGDEVLRGEVQIWRSARDGGWRLWSLDGGA